MDVPHFRVLLQDLDLLRRPGLQLAPELDKRLKLENGNVTKKMHNITIDITQNEFLFFKLRALADMHQDRFSA